MNDAVEVAMERRPSSANDLLQKAPASVTKPARHSHRDHIIGLILLFGVSCSFVLSSLLTQVLSLPFFCSYINNSFSVIYVGFYFIQEGIKQLRHKENKFFTPKRRLIIKDTAKLALAAMPLLYSMSITFNWSLNHTHLTNNSIISSSSSFFAMLSSWLLLRSPLRVINMLGAIFSVVGIGLVSWTSCGTEMPLSIYGDLAALLSAILSGTYASLLTKYIPDGSHVDMTLFFGLIGTFGAALLWPFILLLQHLDVERIITALTAKEIWFLLANAGLTILANLVWAKAVLLTTPFLATIGLGMTTPLTMFTEYIFLSKVNDSPFRFLSFSSLCISPDV
uniref:EamA domain-containing protein n=1 Tax=Spongospora subterranea TaxID=70186 RepID=A0A0H5R060_9EUKA|eukprot:CRZ01204.1 hypothetical protein [Spongospora subterranea]